MVGSEYELSLSVQYKGMDHLALNCYLGRPSEQYIPMSQIQELPHVLV